MRRYAGIVAVLALALLITAFGGGQAQSGAQHGQVLMRAAQGKITRPVLKTTKDGKTVTRRLPFLSDATLQTVQDAMVQNQDERLTDADASGAIPNADFANIGGAKQTLGCTKRNTDGNQRVNQDCSFRRQAEEDITYNPADPKNLIGGQNDSRVGYNQCGIDFSTDGGHNWGDMLPPFRQHENAPEFDGPSAANPNNNTIMGDVGTHHTYDAASDPATAVDSRGRAYFSCVIFDVFSNASGLFVTQSPRGASGSFYFNVPSSIAAVPTKRFLPVEDNSFFVVHDKNMIAADRYKSSPNRDNVYVTWTVFKFNQPTGTFSESPIYGSMSTDHGLSWSTPEEISGTNDQLCFFGNAFTPGLDPHKCNFDQGSNPVALPDGSLEVTFNNGNTPAGNPNGQQLGVHCMPSGSSSAGTAHLNCAQPVKVGDDILTGEPLCDFGRGPEECIPGPWIRTNDFPRITKDNSQNNHLQVVWQDYRNGEFDIQMATSNDGGLTWSQAGTVNPDSGLDHYMPAVDQSPSKGDRIGVSYYRSERVPNENTTPPGGFSPGMPGVQEAKSDYVLAGGSGNNTPYDFDVLSPVFDAPDGVQAGFNGDYSGLTISQGLEAHPIWSDTRNADPFSPANGVVHDEDIFTAKANLPNGKAKTGPGKIGKH